MYTSLHIKGFRCFRDLKIDKLARINLIGGKNNTGKTALLEALQVRASSLEHPYMFAELYIARGLALPSEPGRGARQRFADLFTGFRRSRAATISTSDRDGVTRLTMACVPADGTEVRGRAQPNRSDQRGGPDESRFEHQFTLRLTLKRPRQRAVTKDVKVSDTSWGWAHADAVATSSVASVPARGPLLPARDAERFGELVLQRQEQFLVDALQHLERRLERVVEVYFGGKPVLCADLGPAAPPRPLPFVGEGMNRLASITLALSSVPRGLLLIDEIENGLHHSVMPKVWAAIASAAKDLHVQVFATTHSYECVEAAREAMGEEEGLFLYHRLDRVDDDIRCVTYEPETLRTALEMPWEVR